MIMMTRMKRTLEPSSFLSYSSARGSPPPSSPAAPPFPAAYRSCCYFCMRRPHGAAVGAHRYKFRPVPWRQRPRSLADGVVVVVAVTSDKEKRNTLASKEQKHLLCCCCGSPSSLSWRRRRERWSRRRSRSRAVADAPSSTVTYGVRGAPLQRDAAIATRYSIDDRFVRDTLSKLPKAFDFRRCCCYRSRRSCFLGLRELFFFFFVPLLFSVCLFYSQKKGKVKYTIRCFTHRIKSCGWRLIVCGLCFYEVLNRIWISYFRKRNVTGGV